LGQEQGATLTTLFENAAVPAAAPVDAPVARKKHGWLPLLSVLFLISYGLMTMLIVEQGETIESQRALIRELFRDSRELSAVRMKAQADAQQAAGKVQAPSTQTPSRTTQTQSTQTPSAQAPSSAAPSSQAVPQHRTQNTTKPKPQFELPSKQASDIVDDTRTLSVI
jgi:hypothetical protein